VGNTFINYGGPICLNDNFFQKINPLISATFFLSRKLEKIFSERYNQLWDFQYKIISSLFLRRLTVEMVDAQANDLVLLMWERRIICPWSRGR